MRTLTSVGPLSGAVSLWFVPVEPRQIALGLGRSSWSDPCSPLGHHPRLNIRQISLLISFDLPTIPSPTTASPFRCDRFITLLHRRSLPRLSPLADQTWSRGSRRAVKGSPNARRLPDRLGRSEFALLRTGLFVAGCFPPFLTEDAVTTINFRPVTLAWQGLSPY